MVTYFVGYYCNISSVTSIRDQEIFEWRNSKFLERVQVFYNFEDFFLREQIIVLPKIVVEYKFLPNKFIGSY